MITQRFITLQSWHYTWHEISKEEGEKKRTRVERMVTEETWQTKVNTVKSMNIYNNTKKKKKKVREEKEERRRERERKKEGKREKKSWHTIATN